MKIDPIQKCRSVWFDSFFICWIIIFLPFLFFFNFFVKLLFSDLTMIRKIYSGEWLNKNNDCSECFGFDPKKKRQEKRKCVIVCVVSNCGGYFKVDRDTNCTNRIEAYTIQYKVFLCRTCCTLLPRCNKARSNRSLIRTKCCLSLCAHLNKKNRSNYVIEWYRVRCKFKKKNLI